MLRKYKIQVDCASSGKEAVEIISLGEPVYDAVFMDHMMPEMDGIEATERIRNMDSSYAKTIPVISLTANALAGNEQLFLLKGFNAFLSKPINILQLDAIVKKFLRRKDSGQNTEGAESPRQESSPAPEKSIPEIPGINTEIGLALCDGDMEIYAFALNSFVSHTPGTIEKLTSVSRENIADYAIVVHGLKSVCAAFGAEDARAKAFALENAAKTGDLQAVLAGNEALLKETEKLVSDIRDWLGSRQGNNNG
jgi:CheY-like chemotaxis protein